MEQDISIALSLVKDRLGIRSEVRNTYLTAIIKGVMSELTEEQGIVIDIVSPHHLMFVVDYSTWKYQSRDDGGALPRNLKFRLNNLVIRDGGVSSDV